MKFYHIFIVLILQLDLFVLSHVHSVNASGVTWGNQRPSRGFLPSKNKLPSVNQTPEREQEDITTSLPIPTTRTVPSPCKEKSLSHDFVVDCRQRQLIFLNSEWFPSNTTVLYLDKNNLRTLPNATFSHLSELRYLSARENAIAVIEPNAFAGLHSLEYLDLEKNKLKPCYDSYPKDIFLPLTKVKDLRIRQDQNFQNYSYPVGLFSPFRNLSFLSIDTVGIELSFGSSFAHTKELHILEIGGFVHNISKESFTALKHLSLRELRMRNMDRVTSFDNEALHPLKDLDVLDLRSVRLGLQKALSILKPLSETFNRHKIMSKISLYDIAFASPGTNSSDSVINANSVKYLKRICVAAFSLIYCGVTGIQLGTFSKSPMTQCIRHLDVSRNPAKGQQFVLNRVLEFPNIETFIMINQKGSACNFAKAQMSRERRSSGKPEQSVIENARPTDLDLATVSRRQIGLIFFYVSRTLRLINFDGSGNFHELDQNIHFVGADRLTDLIISNCGINGAVATFLGLTNLTRFDISNNNLSILSETFFDFMPNLEKLSLSMCQLDSDFMSRKSARLFLYLKRLKEVHLAYNLLTLLPPNLFLTNPELQTVDLSFNRFSEIPINLENAPNLLQLDLRNNAISGLTEVETQRLDEIAARNKNFSLLLDGNIMSCACNSIRFLRWLTVTSVHLDYQGNYKCTTDFGTFSDTHSFSDNDALWRKCFGKSFFYLSLILLSTMIIGFLTVILMSKYQTSIRSFLLSVVIKNITLKAPADYTYGVYLGYADADHRFPCHTLRPYIEDHMGLSTFIRHRDILLGGDMAGDIVDAIHDSWRIVLVITESFLKDDEVSIFTMKCVVYAQGPENPRRIVLIVKESLRNLLPAYLVNCVSDDNIVWLPEMKMCYELREKLKHFL